MPVHVDSVFPRTIAPVFFSTETNGASAKDWFPTRSRYPPVAFMSTVS